MLLVCRETRVVVRIVVVIAAIIIVAIGTASISVIVIGGIGLI